ncbi:glycoside hydrolase superfamily, partial [Mycena crocata]
MMQEHEHSVFPHSRETTGSEKGSSPYTTKLYASPILVVILAVAVAVAVRVGLLVVKKKHDYKAPPPITGGNAEAQEVSECTGTMYTTVPGLLHTPRAELTVAIVGLAALSNNGTNVTTTNGEIFVYNNTFEGYWLPTHLIRSHIADVPTAGRRWLLNESWSWGVDRVYGVNLGGWFVLEPFIVPPLFEPYPTAFDEWDLATLMRADGTLEATMEKHYDTSIYVIRVSLDLHTIPESQNAYDHSGKRGQINFLNGPMGIANARTLECIRTITEFISQPQWRDVVPVFGIINEPTAS